MRSEVKVGGWSLGQGSDGYWIVAYDMIDSPLVLSPGALRDLREAIDQALGDESPRSIVRHGRLGYEMTGATPADWSQLRDVLNCRFGEAPDKDDRHLARIEADLATQRQRIDRIVAVLRTRQDAPEDFDQALDALLAEEKP